VDDVESTAHLPRLAATPADDGPSVPLPPREGLRGTLLVLAVAVLVLLGAAGLSSAIRSQSVQPPIAAEVAPPPSPTASSPSVPVTPAGPAVYRAPEDLCAQADFTALRPTFDQIGDLSPIRNSSAGYTFAQCEGTTGNDTVQGTFLFRITVYTDAAMARTQFDTARTGAGKLAKVAAVEGVGQAGYAYADPTVGPTVEIYDNNLRIRLSWGASDRKAAVPVGVTSTLAHVCASTMRLLRDN
jgi:hypothetical protein